MPAPSALSDYCFIFLRFSFLFAADTIAELMIERMQNAQSRYTDTLLPTKFIVGLYLSSTRKTMNIPDSIITICGKTPFNAFILFHLLDYQAVGDFPAARVRLIYDLIIECHDRRFTAVQIVCAGAAKLFKQQRQFLQCHAA